VKSAQSDHAEFRASSLEKPNRPRPLDSGAQAHDVWSGRRFHESQIFRIDHYLGK